MIHLERLVTVIQDKDCLVQVGGDDRVGVAIELWLAMKTDLPMALLFTTDEEIGLLSARQVEFPELMDFELLVQIDTK
jgi:putative aminopeptidase FrvX